MRKSLGYRSLSFDQVLKCLRARCARILIAFGEIANIAATSTASRSSISLRTKTDLAMTPLMTSTHGARRRYRTRQNEGGGRRASRDLLRLSNSGNPPIDKEGGNRAAFGLGEVMSAYDNARPLSSQARDATPDLLPRCATSRPAVGSSRRINLGEWIRAAAN